MDLNGEFMKSPREQETKITYENLRHHIINMHPTKSIDKDSRKRSKFSICDPIGFLPVFKWLNKKPSDLSQELGVGPTLFLMSTRGMFWLFTFLTIINIPVFAYYYKGTSSDADGEATTN